jgi:sulfotransferase 6B1
MNERQMGVAGTIVRFVRECTTAKEENSAGTDVLAISMPKCGTHLLTRLVSSLTGCTRSNQALRTGNVSEAQQIIDHHRSVASKQHTFLRGHQCYSSEIETLLTEQGFRVFIMLRDPRDTVVSHAHWVTNEKHRSDGNRRFYNSLPTLDERLMASICGRPKGWNEGTVSAKDSELLDYHGEREDIGRRLQRYIPWIESDVVCLLRFENLVGAEGGGCSTVQLEEICKAATHLGIDQGDFDAEAVANGLFDRTVRTFRRGEIGGWAESFNNLHKIAFKAVAGKALITLGYEQDYDW